MEKVMAACRMSGEDMVLFIPHQLTGQADIWWVGVCDAWTAARGPITWEVFLAQFKAKYYPDSFREKMNDALNHIQQGDRSVDGYERDFSNIVRFVPSVASDEREMARRFFTGLNAKYREVMGRNPPVTYITTVEEAKDMETQFQLTILMQRHNGSGSNTSVIRRGLTRRVERPHNNLLPRSSRQITILSSLNRSILSTQGLRRFQNYTAKEECTCCCAW